MNTQTKKFKSSLLQKSCNIGKYELWLDGSTGWGIIFPNGLIEVEEGPHESSGWMFGHINNINIFSKGQNLPRIPDEYWQGEMPKELLAEFFDEIISKYFTITN